MPGHEKIQGNEEADRLAKEGAALLEDRLTQATYAGVKRLRKTTIKKQFATWWEEASQGCKRYRELGFSEATLKAPKELDLPRRTLHNLLALRSGHGDFDWYHKKFRHPQNDRCACRMLRTPEHLVHCRKTRRLRAQWPKFDPEPKTLQEYWQRLVHDPEKFQLFVTLTRYYEDICPPPVGRGGHSI